MFIQLNFTDTLIQIPTNYIKDNVPIDHSLYTVIINVYKISMWILVEQDYCTGSTNLIIWIQILVVKTTILNRECLLTCHSKISIYMIWLSVEGGTHHNNIEGTYPFQIHCWSNKWLDYSCGFLTWLLLALRNIDTQQIPNLLHKCNALRGSCQFPAFIFCCYFLYANWYIHFDVWALKETIISRHLKPKLCLFQCHILCIIVHIVWPKKY